MGKNALITMKSLFIMFGAIILVDALSLFYLTLLVIERRFGGIPPVGFVVLLNILYFLSIRHSGPVYEED